MMSKYIEGISAPFIRNTPMLQPVYYGRALSDMLAKMLETERLSAAELLKIQAKRLQNLLAYAVKYSPYYRELAASNQIDVTNGNALEVLAKFPLLRRRDIQDNQTKLESSQLYKTHQPVGRTQTSGSSGQPVVVVKTSVSQRFWHANTLREHAWFGRDFSKNMAAIRAFNGNQSMVTAPSWGEPVSLVVEKTGRGNLCKISLPVNDQLSWLLSTNAAYVTIYPSNLAAMLDCIEKRNVKMPHLEQIRSIGETLSPNLRQRVWDVLGVPVVDVYSSQELGVIAMQCPDSDTPQYHVMADSHVVEILKDDGSPCAEGEIGRVVVTDLTNFAMPLIRYDIGDYAVQGGACSCGRCLPTLQRILGRERNMAIHRGQKFWPMVGFAKFRDIAPIRQYQIIQTAEDALEARLVVDTPLTSDQETALSAVILKAMGFEAKLTFNYFEGQIPPSAGGKFEEFVCAIR